MAINICIIKKNTDTEFWKCPKTLKKRIVEIFTEKYTDIDELFTYTHQENITGTNVYTFENIKRLIKNGNEII